MKKYHILIFLLFAIISNSFSQSDTVYIVKTDTVFVTEKQDIMYKMFVENKEPEIKHLWKMNLVKTRLLKPDFGYEQKIAKSWSAELYVSYGYENQLSTDEYGSKNNISYEFEQSFKYYFNLKSRERRGLNTKGFSGDYFATSVSLSQKEYDDPIMGMDTSYKYSIYYSEVKNLGLGFKYGIQRKIGRFGYVEFFTGWNYNFIWKTKNKNSLWWPPNDVSWTEYSHRIFPFVGIKAGLAIGSFDNLKGRLKD